MNKINLRVKLFQAFLLLIFFSFNVATGLAGVIKSTATGGAWNAGSTWVGGNAPTANDTAIIASGATIILSGTVSITRLVFDTNTVANTSLNLADNASLTVVGQLLMNAPKNTTLTVTNLLNVGNGTAVFGNIKLNNSNNDIRRVVLRDSTGSITIQGLADFSVNNSGSRRAIEITGNGRLSFNGSIAGSAGLFLNSASTVTYNASGNFPIINDNYGNLIINGRGVKTYGSNSDRIISGTLSLNKTNLRTLSNLQIAGLALDSAFLIQTNGSLSLAPGAPITGNIGTAAHILQTGSGGFSIQGTTLAHFQRTFPIGTTLGYNPFSIQKLEASLTGGNQVKSIEVRSLSLAHPLVASGTQVLKRFFRIRTSNISNITKSALTFQYLNEDVVGVTESALDKIARLGAAGWNSSLSGSTFNHTTNTFSVDSSNNLLSGDWTLGESAAFPSTISSVYTITNGSWGSASTWSNNQKVTRNSDVIVLHNVTDVGDSVRNVIVAPGGNMAFGPSNGTVLGNIEVFGILGDVHSGGVNRFAGKLTVRPTGTLIFTGSGSGTNTECRDDVENFGAMSIDGRLNFTGVSKTRIRFTSNSPVTLTKALMTSVDSLILNVPMLSPLDDSLRLGIPSQTNTCQLHNFGSLVVNGRVFGRLANGGNAQSRQLIQRAGSSVSFGLINTAPFAGGTGQLVADQHSNTVEYAGSGSQSVLAQNYHNLTISGDRADRFKTLLPGASVNIKGNLTVNNNGAVFQWSSSGLGQHVNVDGDLILSGNGQVRLPNGLKGNRLSVGGKVVVNSDPNFNCIDLRSNDTTFGDLHLRGTGVKAEGNRGNIQVRSLIFTSNGTQTWNANSLVSIFDSLRFASDTFSATKGTFFVPVNRTVLIHGNGKQNTLNRLTITDRADRTSSVRQTIPLIVDSLFQLNMSGNSSPNAFYSIAGTSLKINRSMLLSRYGGGQNPANSALRVDSNSTLILSGNGQITNPTFAPGFRTLGTLRIERSNASDTIMAGGSAFAIAKRLELINGRLRTMDRIGVRTGGLVQVGKGRLLGNLANSSGKYSVEYTDSIRTGTELTSIPALARLVINAKANDVVAINNTPLVDSNLVYTSGQMAAIGNSYVRLGTTSNVVISSTIPNVLFPVGVGNAKGFFEMAVNQISNPLRVRPFLIPHPKRASAPHFINRYVQVSGQGASNYALSVWYNDADVVGSEDSLDASFYNGTSWITASNVVDKVNNKVTLTGLQSAGDVTAGKRMGDTVIVSAKILSTGLVKLYPNPAKDFLKITSSISSTLQMFDVRGTLVLTQALAAGEQNVQVGHLKRGLYVLRLQTQKGESLTEKWMLD